MSSTDDEKPSLKESLLRQGVPREEIKKIYRTLRERGYGEEEARPEQGRTEKTSAEKTAGDKAERSPGGKAQPGKPPGDRQAERSAASKPAVDRRRPPGPKSGQAPVIPAPAGTSRRAADWVPEVQPWLRRRINRYAFRNGFLITGAAERFDDFVRWLDPARGDFASRALLRLLADEKGWKGRNPFRLSFIDCLNALRESAARLLGAQPEDGPEAVRALEIREPFAVELFSVFTQPHEMLRRSLTYLAGPARDGRRVRVFDLARVVKDGCRLIWLAGSMERERLEGLVDVARQLDADRAPDGRPTAAFADAEAVFRGCYQSLGLYRHELYPALLKMIGSFYEEEDRDPQKGEKILAFLGLREEDILTWAAWQRRLAERREREMRERQAQELARLEEEKSASISVRYEGTLSMMGSLFPDSGIERVEQGVFVLPYFVNRVFGRSPLFQARQQDIEYLASADIMGPILIFHALLDDMLMSVDAYVLEKMVGRERYGDELVLLRDSWHDAFPRLFEPYLETARDYAREMGGDLRYVRLFREGPRARALEERINQLRNRAIRNFGHLITAKEHYDAPRLYELAARLAALLTEAGELINQGMLTAEDPVSRRARDELAAKRVVDLEAVSVPGSLDFRPVTRQVRRWIEARFRETVGDAPHRSQVAFMDVFRGVAYLYESLLNDPESFASRSSHAVVTATVEDRAAWSRERTERGRDSQQSLQATLREEFPGQFVDALTGLRNKDYFITELPRVLEKLRSHAAAVTLLMIDVDHFKWINDTLGHTRGDEVLTSTAAMILDGIREGDLAVRYGGEEILIVVPSDLHRGIVLAERLRYSQENKVLTRDAMHDVLTVGVTGGGPCGTLSVGVADVTPITDLAKAVEKVDRALYAAKKERNTVVYIDPVKEKLSTDPFLTYGDYRRKAGGFTA